MASKPYSSASSIGGNASITMLVVYTGIEVLCHPVLLLRWLVLLRIASLHPPRSDHYPVELSFIAAEVLAKDVRPPKLMKVQNSFQLRTWVRPRWWLLDNHFRFYFRIFLFLRLVFFLRPNQLSSERV